MGHFVDSLKTLVKRHPPIYDLGKRLSRLVPRYRRDPIYQFFCAFSEAHGGRVKFIQLGANDGLRSDPIREFIIQQRWEGVLVEPLPTSFDMLKKNYHYLKNRNLHFVNAAISESSEPSESLQFWSLDPDFLRTQSLERQLELLRGASFSRDHLARILRPGEQQYLTIQHTELRTVDSLVAEFFPDSCPDLIVIDTEGHEKVIIPSIDLKRIPIKALFYEAHALKESREEIENLLAERGYRNMSFGGDNVALSADCVI